MTSYSLGESPWVCRRWRVSLIQEKVVADRYHLSPLGVKILPLIDYPRDDIMYQYVIYVQNYPFNCIGVVPEDSDKIVLSAIARILNQVILSKDILLKNSFGLRTHINDFYQDVISRGNVVDGLYKVDLCNSLKTIDQSIILNKLESLIGNTPVFGFVKSLFSLPYFNIHDNEEEIYLKGVSIPPVGLLTDVLLNLALTDLDNEINNHPSILYSRYIHEVYLSNIPENYENDIAYLLRLQHFCGHIIYIRPGDEPVKCYAGMIWIDQSGKINVKYKSNKIENENIN